MTDPILYAIEATSLVGTFLVTYLYVFSTPMREVTASANYNFREWIRGRWSIRTGRSTIPIRYNPLLTNTTSATQTYTTTTVEAGEFE